ncbi:MAG: ATP synthase F1 subunit epsilon [Clostridia bacterium]|nr:ATP synthase F1 subunit epsilon [Clostridia bacterium]
MNGFPLEIVTPDGSIYSGEALRIIVRTTEGDIGILKGHANLLVPIAIGEARVLSADGERSASCSGGMLTVSEGTVRVVAVTFEWADEIDIERAKRAKERAERALQQKLDNYEFAMAQYRLKRSLNRIRIGSDKKDS